MKNGIFGADPKLFNMGFSDGGRGGGGEGVVRGPK